MGTLPSPLALAAVEAELRRLGGGRLSRAALATSCIDLVVDDRDASDIKLPRLEVGRAGTGGEYALDFKSLRESGRTATGTFAAGGVTHGPAADCFEGLLSAWLAGFDGTAVGSAEYGHGSAGLIRLLRQAMAAGGSGVTATLRAVPYQTLAPVDMLAGAMSDDDGGDLCGDAAAHVACAVTPAALAAMEAALHLPAPELAAAIRASAVGVDSLGAAGVGAGDDAAAIARQALEGRVPSTGISARRGGGAWPAARSDVDLRIDFAVVVVELHRCRSSVSGSRGGEATSASVARRAAWASAGVVGAPRASDILPPVGDVQYSRLAIVVLDVPWMHATPPTGSAGAPPLFAGLRTAYALLAAAALKTKRRKATASPTGIGAAGAAASALATPAGAAAEFAAGPLVAAPLEGSLATLAGLDAPPSQRSPGRPSSSRDATGSAAAVHGLRRDIRVERALLRLLHPLLDADSRALHFYGALIVVPLPRDGGLSPAGPSGWTVVPPRAQAATATSHDMYASFACVTCYTLLTLACSSLTCGGRVASRLIQGGALQQPAVVTEDGPVPRPLSPHAVLDAVHAAATGSPQASAPDRRLLSPRSPGRGVVASASRSLHVSFADNESGSPDSGSSSDGDSGDRPAARSMPRTTATPGDDDGVRQLIQELLAPPQRPLPAVEPRTPPRRPMSPGRGVRPPWAASAPEHPCSPTSSRGSSSASALQSVADAPVPPSDPVPRVLAGHHTLAATGAPISAFQMALQRAAGVEYALHSSPAATHTLASSQRQAAVAATAAPMPVGRREAATLVNSGSVTRKNVPPPHGADGINRSCMSTSALMALDTAPAVLPPPSVHRAPASAMMSSSHGVGGMSTTVPLLAPNTQLANVLPSASTVQVGTMPSAPPAMKPWFATASPPRAARMAVSAAPTVKSRSPSLPGSAHGSPLRGSSVLVPAPAQLQQPAQQDAAGAGCVTAATPAAATLPTQTILTDKSVMSRQGNVWLIRSREPVNAGTQTDTPPQPLRPPAVVAGADAHPAVEPSASQLPPAGSTSAFAVASRAEISTTVVDDGSMKTSSATQSARQGAATVAPAASRLPVPAGVAAAERAQPVPELTASPPRAARPMPSSPPRDTASVEPSTPPRGFASVLHIGSGSTIGMAITPSPPGQALPAAGLTPWLPPAWLHRVYTPPPAAPATRTFTLPAAPQLTSFPAAAAAAAGPASPSCTHGILSAAALSDLIHLTAAVEQERALLAAERSSPAPRSQRPSPTAFPSPPPASLQASTAFPSPPPAVASATLTPRAPTVLPSSQAVTPERRVASSGARPFDGNSPSSDEADEPAPEELTLSVLAALQRSQMRAALGASSTWMRPSQSSLDTSLSSMTATHARATPRHDAAALTPLAPRFGFMSPYAATLERGGLFSTDTSPAMSDQQRSPDDAGSASMALLSPAATMSPARYLLSHPALGLGDSSASVSTCGGSIVSGVSAGSDDGRTPAHRRRHRHKHSEEGDNEAEDDFLTLSPDSATGSSSSSAGSDFSDGRMVTNPSAQPQPPAEPAGASPPMSPFSAELVRALTVRHARNFVEEARQRLMPSETAAPSSKADAESAAAQRHTSADVVAAPVPSSPARGIAGAQGEGKSAEKRSPSSWQLLDQVAAGTVMALAESRRRAAELAEELARSRAALSPKPATGAPPAEAPAATPTAGTPLVGAPEGNE